jgi:hypothetical protein
VISAAAPFVLVALRYFGKAGHPTIPADEAHASRGKIPDVHH